MSDRWKNKCFSEMDVVHCSFKSKSRLCVSFGLSESVYFNEDSTHFRHLMIILMSPFLFLALRILIYCLILFFILSVLLCFILWYIFLFSFLSCCPSLERKCLQKTCWGLKEVWLTSLMWKNIPRVALSEEICLYDFVLAFDPDWMCSVFVGFIYLEILWLTGLSDLTLSFYNGLMKEEASLILWFFILFWDELFVWKI